MKDYYGIIYCATNTVNGKKYIGQTIRDFDRRKKEHISQSKRADKYSFHFALNKYGENSFVWSVLDKCNNQEELDTKEIYWIGYYDTYGRNGYNMSLGGQFNKRTADNGDILSVLNGGKEFLIYDASGKFIKSTFSQTDFAKEIGVIVQSVNNVLIGKKSQVKELILIFKNEFSQERLESQIKRATDWHRDFAVFTKENEFVGIWNNQTHCGEAIGASTKAIRMQLDNPQVANNGRKFKFYYLSNIPEGLQHKLKDVI